MPPYLAGREAEQAVFAKAMGIMQSDGIGNIIVMYGPRGTGKTVLLGWLENQCEEQGIDVAHTTPSTGLKSIDSLPKLLLPTNWLPDEISASAGGILSAKWTNPDTGKKVDFAEHLVQACQKRSKVLLLDEAHTLAPDVARELLNISQLTARKSPFLLILAGTPGLNATLMSVGATFVERAEKIGVGRLDEQSAADAIRVPLQKENILIEDKLLTSIVQDAQRYPYFLQLWGDALWDVATEHKLTKLTAEQVRLAEPNVQKKKQAFYASRYELMMKDEELLAAANAVGRAFGDKDTLNIGDVIGIIEDSLSHNLPDKSARRNRAQELNEELNRIDYIWHPPGSVQAEPGIPSFMTYLNDRQ